MPKVFEANRTDKRVHEGLESRATAWQLTNLTPLAQTATARLWRAQCPQGDAVLKVFSPLGHEEISGAYLLEAWGGERAAKIYALASDAVLMEWLPGPCLTAIVRSGRDTEAAEILVRCAMPRADATAPATLHRLAEWLDPLIILNGSFRDAIQRAKPLARSLLSDTAEQVPIHGDLHHENILYGPRGWAVIDPKGILGAQGFEVAPAFRNPLGMESLTHDQGRVERLARLFASGLGMAPRTVLQWAIVGTAISAVWDINTGKDASATERLLTILWAATD